MLPTETPVCLTSRPYAAFNQKLRYRKSGAEKQPANRNTNTNPSYFNETRSFLTRNLDTACVVRKG